MRKMLRCSVPVSNGALWSCGCFCGTGCVLGKFAEERELDRGAVEHRIVFDAGGGLVCPMR